MLRGYRRLEMNRLMIIQRSLSSSSQKLSNNLSYYQKDGREPLQYKNLGQILKSSAMLHPDREAIVSCSENSRLTFAETLDQVDKLSTGLLNLGLSQGDRVALWAPNYEFWFVSMLAIARAGLVCVAMNPVYQAGEVKFCLEKVKVKAVISPEVFRKQKHYEILMSLLPSLQDPPKFVIHSDRKLSGAINYQELIKSSSENEVKKIEQLQTLISPDSACNIQFSSGTTGKPKAATVSHFSVVNNGYNIGLRHGLDQNYRRICVNNPFFHAYGVVIAIANALSHASTLVIPAQHFSPSASLKTIVKEKCDVIYGTPTMYVDLITRQREENHKIPDIAFGVTGGAICTPKLVDDIKNYLKVDKLYSIYGLTETTASSFQSLHDDKAEMTQEFVGCLSDHLEAKIIDEKGNAVPFGQPGELCLRGYSTFLGYFGDDEKTREAMGWDKWFKTGDQFVLYPNGYGKIVGRLKEMIIRGGENIFPREIEDFLNTHPMIDETHVIGIPDERFGEEVAAFIRLKNPNEKITKDEIKEFCKGTLSHFKIPRYFYFVDEFPKTVSGKIQKFKFFDVFKNLLEK